MNTDQEKQGKADRVIAMLKKALFERKSDHEWLVEFFEKYKDMKKPTDQELIDTWHSLIIKNPKHAGEWPVVLAIEVKGLLEAQSRLVRMEERERFEEEIYRFPKWINDDMKENFYGMWRCFRRTPADYFENKRHLLNGKQVKASHSGLGKFGLVQGEYYHKWNNMGWVFDGKEVHLVFNAEIPIQ